MVATKGDLLIIITNGSKDLVGKVAVFDSDEINSFQIPVPYISTQRKQIQKYRDTLIESKKLRKEANDNVNNTNEFLET